MKLAALLLFAAAQAHAEILMTEPNQDGGLIQFANTPCPGKGLEAYVVTGDGEAIEEGCWSWSGKNISILWDSTGDTYYYDPADMTLTKAGKQFIRRKGI